MKQVLVLLAVMFLASQVSAADPPLPTPAPVVAQVLERNARLQAGHGLAVGSGREFLAFLNRELRLGLKTKQIESMGAHLDQEVLSGMDWVAEDLLLLLRDTNRTLKLEIKDQVLITLRDQVKNSSEQLYRDCDPGSRPGLTRTAAFIDATANTAWNPVGSTAVVVILIRPPGEPQWDNSWPFYDISTACGRAGDGMQFYKDKAPGQANISYNVYYYKESVSTTPSNNRNCDDAWMDEALQKIGYSDNDGDGTRIDDATAYLKSYYGTTNCILVFIPKEAGRSYACRGGYYSAGGPHTTVFFYSTWPFLAGSEVYSHELGHLFGACDEYWQDDGGGIKSGCDYNDPSDASGEWCDDPCKLVTPSFMAWGLNGNCEKCNGSSVNCVMKKNSDVVCSYTKKQFGWSDHDSDGIIDALDADPANTGPACNNGAPENTAPVTAVNALSARTQATSVPVSWTGTDACDSVVSYNIQVKDGSGSWTSWKSAVSITSDSYSGTDWHTYYFRSQAVDNFGNLETYPTAADAFTTVMVGAGPSPTISSSTHPDPGAYVDDNDPKFSWTVDSASDRSQTELFDDYSYVLDQFTTTTPDVTAEGPTASRSYTNSADGTWYFHVRARDRTGTWTPAAHRKILIDTGSPAAPVVSSSTHPVNTTWYNNGTVTVQWVPPADLSGIAGYSMVGLNHDPYTNPDKVVDQTGNSKNYYSVTTGVWWVHVRARDNLGHWGSTSHFKIQVDRSGPALPAVTSSTHSSPSKWYNSNDPTFSWNNPDDDSGIGGFSYYDSSQPLDMPDAVSEGTGVSTSLTDVAEGTRYFHIRARDNAVSPNWGDASHFQYRVDTIPPNSVTALTSSSHGSAIGQWNNPQSADNTVTVSWTTASDPSPGSGADGYSIAWDHSSGTTPDMVAEMNGTQVSTTSTSLEDGSDWYVHIRTADAAGNWSADTAHLGPFFINTAPPTIPSGLSLNPGNSVVNLDWNDNVTDPDFAGFNVYRSTSSGSGYSRLNGSSVFVSDYVDAAVQNGVQYYYVVTALDSVGNESGYSSENSGMPEYSTPGNGNSYTLANLVTISNYGIVGAAPTFQMRGSVTVSAGDTLVVSPGETLLSTDMSGTKKLIILGTLIADGTVAQGLVSFGSTTGQPGRWGGLELQNPGPGTVIDSCVVEYGQNGIVWITSGSMAVTHSLVQKQSAEGIVAVCLPGATADLSYNTITDNGADGLFFQADSSVSAAITWNTINDNGDDGIQYAFFTAWSPALLNIANNTVIGNAQSGVRLGQGGSTTFISDNDIRENNDGIYFDGETIGARPIIQRNNVQANLVSGMHLSNQARPLLDDNTIVGNLTYGVYCSYNSEPILKNNTITGSRYGVYITTYTGGWPTPDLGSLPNASGSNSIHGHSIYSVYTDAPDSVRAHYNWWGTTTTAEMDFFGPGVLGNITTIYDAWDAVLPPLPGMVMYQGWSHLGTPAPTITINKPSAGSPTVDSTFTVSWTAFDGEEDAQINLYYDTDTTGLDGTVITGGSGLSEDSDPDSLTWDTSPVHPGTYYVYGVIDDGWTSVSDYSDTSIVIDHPRIVVTPDTISSVMSAQESRADTVLVSNNSVNYPLTFSCTAADTLGNPILWMVPSPDTGTVAGGESTQVVLTLNTAGFSAGSYAGTLHFASNDPIDSLVVAPFVDLSVAFPIGALSDTAHAYGTLNVGNTADWQVTVYNLGTAELIVDSLSTSNSEYVFLSASPPDTIPSTDSLAYTLRFDPTLTDTSSATAALFTNDPYDSVLTASAYGSAVAPDIAVSDTAHDYGTHDYGTMDTWSLWISNSGNADLSVDSLTVNMADYSIASPSFPDTLSPGDSLLTSLAYDAATVGTTGAALSIHTNDPDENPLDVALSAYCVKPELSLSDTAHVFGTVRVDSTTGWSFTAGNSGTADLVLQQVSGTNSDYSTSSPAFPDTIPPGDSVLVSMAFTPFSLGASNDDLSLLSNDAEDSVSVIHLTGTGGLPTLAPADSSHDYGSVSTLAYSDWTLTVRNTGTTSLRLDSLATGDPELTLLETLPTFVPAGDSTSLTVRFAPGTPDSLNADVEIHSGDPVDPVVWLPVSGLGLEPDLSLSASSHNYGEVLLGVQEDWTLWVQNLGNDNLVLTSASLSDTVFSILAPVFPDTLGPSDSVGVQVRFEPTNEEIANDGLTLRTDDPLDSVRVIQVIASGVWPNLNVIPDPIDEVVFENTVGRPSVAVRNVGTGSVWFNLTESDSTFAPSPPLLPETALVNKAEAMISPSRRQGVGFQSLAIDIPWISLENPADTLTTGRSSDIGLNLDATALSQGVYKSSLEMQSSDPDSAHVWVPLRMRIPRMRFADHDPGGVILTVTDEGCFGFFDLSHYLNYGEGYYYGNGFSRKTLDNALWHGALWVGTDSSHVSDGSFDYDWNVSVGGALTMQNMNQFGDAVFDDSHAPNPIGVRVAQHSLALATDPDDDYVRLEFTVENTGGTPLDSVYVGLWLDWDVLGAWNNGSGYSSPEALGYSFNAGFPDSVHYGTCMLDPMAPASFRLVHNPTWFHPTANMADSSKYAFLSAGTIDTVSWEATDWSMLMTSGPYAIAAGESVGVAFAILSGVNLSDLKVNAARARARYPIGIVEAEFNFNVRDNWVEILWSAPGIDQFDLLRACTGEDTPKKLNSSPISCGNECRFVDRSVVPDETYTYVLESRGTLLAGPVKVHVPLPVVLRLSPSYPNPFSPKTHLNLDLPKRAKASIQIFDLAGRMIRNLHDGFLEKGRTTLTWDGLNETGRRVSSGVYFFRLVTGQQTLSRKMVLVR